MRQFGIVFGICLVVSSVLLGQNNIALLNTPVRSLKAVELNLGDQVSIPFQLDRGMIYVSARVEQHTGQFVLDTGAPSLVLNELPTGADSPYLARSCSDALAVGVKQVASFQWGDRELRNVEAITLDLSHLEQARKAPVVGMIGYELLKNQTLFLDYQRQQLVLVDAKTRKRQSLVAPLARISFELDGHLPVIVVWVGEQELRLGIDTGAAANVLNQSKHDVFGANSTPLAAEELQGLDQNVQQVLVRQIDHLNAAGFDFSGKFLFTDLSHLDTVSGQPLDGLLGYAFLSQYLVAIDYNRNELLLWPRASEQ
ncbi:MAG: hypothetical protein DA408_10885 [Bacteroidetes bacterium]|nr:MAG: hypothetical protein C7N36_11825 [Bacteroidota bacterium]PTM12360.1 MAG: hypothetical protein DA408_10885 [Bacteroidota bacterium]